jgi:hypothetical protein
VALDADANEAALADAVIGAVVSDPDRLGASAAVAVVTAREDLEIALQVRKLLGGEARSSATPGRPIS